MTEKELREKAVATARSYLGAKQGSVLHKKIIDTFNKVKPDGWAMTYTAYWCAAFVSADAILAFGIDKAKKYFPLSANCVTIITKAKKMGIFVENDAYKAKPGDWLLYDWDEKSSKGDNKNSPDHVGIVESVSNNVMTIIEGNFRQASGTRVVAERKVAVNGLHIRGFVTPKYSAMATKPKKTEKKKSVDQIAQEVIDGKWGTGENREKKLIAAGYDYAAVQKKVNELMAKKEPAKKKKKTPVSKKIVNLAAKQLGNGYKKYCKAFGKNTSWCQIFMWWLMDKEGQKYIKNSFARKAAAWCKKHWKHVSVKNAAAGDFCFFVRGHSGNNKMKGFVVHVGLIRKKSAKATKGKNKGDWVVYTIEGNVNGKKKDQRGSWKNKIVAKRTRNIDRVWGIFRPPWKN